MKRHLPLILAAGAALFACSEASKAATFTPTRDGVRISGILTPADGVTFLDKVAGPVVELDTPGGDVAGGLAIAETIRRRGLETRIVPNGKCLSMCVIIFFAGVKRAAHTTSYLAVHSASAATPTLAKTVTENLAARLRRYGAPESIIARMLATPNTSFDSLGADDLPDDVTLLP